MAQDVSCLGTDYVPSEILLDDILRYQSCSRIHFHFLHYVHMQVQVFCWCLIQAL